MHPSEENVCFSLLLTVFLVKVRFFYYCSHFKTLKFKRPRCPPQQFGVTQGVFFIQNGTTTKWSDLEFAIFFQNTEIQSSEVPSPTIWPNPGSFFIQYGRLKTILCRPWPLPLCKVYFIEDINIFFNLLILIRCSWEIPCKIFIKCIFQFLKIGIIALPPEMQTSKTRLVTKCSFCKSLKVSLFVRETSMGFYVTLFQNIS